MHIIHKNLDKNGISEAANPLNGIERNYGVQLGKVSMPTNGLRPEKSLEVLEKEYRLKFLLEAFPEVDAMVCSDIY